MPERATRSVPAGIWLVAAALLLFGVRAATMLGSGAGLHVDEAQYWDWSRSLQWGYYSKPPLIAALIAASTALFGDGLFGVRALAMGCWLGASLVAWRIGVAMGSARAGLWAALCLAATPASGLLGLAATTDAPLMLCWSLAMAASWRALASDAPAWRWWALAGVALGIGLLAKFTMAAIVASWVLLAWQRRASRAVPGLLLAAAIGVLLLAPNLAWNAAQGWPTLRHTAEITVGAARSGSRLASLAEYLAGQLLLAGPVLVLLAALLWRRGRRAGAVADARLQAARSFALAFAWPLLLVGALQALASRTQMNWTAPALVGLCLWVGLLAQRVAAPRAWLVVATLAGVLLASGIALGGDLRRFVAPERRGWDIWARMRGWDTALDALRPALAAHPALPLRANRRDLIVHAAYAWRDLRRPVLALPRDGPPRNHYEMRAGAPTGRLGAGATDAWLLLSSAPPDAALRRDHPRIELLAEARSGTRVVQLWRLARAGSPTRAQP